MAGRIPQAFIDDLLARINVLDIVEARVKLKRTGKNYSGLCPFHKEKSPSFTVNSDKQFYYCFGCGAGGNALGFMMEHDRLSFPEAIEELAKLAGVEVPTQQGPVDHQREQRIKDIYSLLEDAAEYYQQQLRTHAQKDQAVTYLKNRGLSGKVAALFGIGYAPPGWDNLLKKLAKDNATRDRLEQAGMLINKEGTERFYDRFRERIMFPIKDMRGRVIAFGGRVLGDEKPKYLNSPETDTFHKSRELYGLYEARKYNQKLNRLIIVEGYMDVVGLAQFGITYAVATLGTATTAQHLERLLKMVPEVIFCFDGDDAGRKAAKRALETTLPVITDGKEARFLFLPEGEDPDSLVRQEGTEAFEQRLNEALPLSEFFFRSVSEDADMNSLDGRARFSNEALPKIQQMQPSILRSMMQERISELTGLSLDQLNSVSNLQEATQTHSTYQPGYDDNQYSQPGNDYYSDAEYPNYSDKSYSEKSYSDSGYSENSYSDNDDYQSGRKNKKGRKKFRKPPPPGGSAISITPSSSAVSILLHAPSLANQCQDLEFLTQSQNLTDQLLFKLISYLQTHPDATLGSLFVDWQTDSEYTGLIVQLNEISHLEPVIDKDNAHQVLRDTLQRLHEHHIDTQIKNLQSKTPKTSDEAQLVMKLLADQHNMRNKRSQK